MSCQQCDPPLMKERRCVFCITPGSAVSGRMRDHDDGEPCGGRTERSGLRFAPQLLETYHAQYLKGYSGKPIVFCKPESFFLPYRKLRKNRPREQNFDARRTLAEVNAGSARFFRATRMRRMPKPVKTAAKRKKGAGNDVPCREIGTARPLCGIQRGGDWKSQ